MLRILSFMILAHHCLSSCVDDNDAAAAVTGGAECSAVAASSSPDYCAMYFCPTCAMPSTCDLSCGYCTTTTATEAPTPAPTPAPTSPACADDNDAAAAVTGGAECSAVAASSSPDYCAMYFCPTCAMPSTCDLSCGYCTTTATEATPAPTVATEEVSSAAPTVAPTLTAVPTVTFVCGDDDAAASAATGGAAPSCSAISAAGYCELYFCPTCALPGTCDLACGYCTLAPTPMMGYAPSATPTVTAVPTTEAITTALQLQHHMDANGGGADDDGVTITLTSDVVLDKPVTVSAGGRALIAGDVSDLDASRRRLPSDGSFFGAGGLATGATISGGGLTSSFSVDGGTLELYALTLANGTALDPDSGMWGDVLVSGAAVNVMNGGTLKATACIFAHNTAKTGGALFIQSGSTAVISGCRFSRNVATIAGAAILAYSETENALDLSDSEFVENSGAAVFLARSTHRISNCKFVDNHGCTEYAGGAVLMLYVLAATIDDSVFERNTVPEAVEGGALSIDASGVTVLGLASHGVWRLLVMVRQRPLSTHMTCRPA